MHERMRERLKGLREEWNLGNQRLVEMEAEHGRLREVLLRIAGAIQVIEEELASSDGEDQNQG
ncbi:hypothetical protein N825_28250 [Skermanella stibiiresistens SB22]|uniref:Uncharacterized protein n=2 Tax=Skermanella TaxID=204447 RepID=W9HBZ0_9PROT|nr:hypothetical protein N825_28250 [Skermanella stibiiresistens SB22]